MPNQLFNTLKYRAFRAFWSYINILSLSAERVRRPHTHRAMVVRGDRPLGLGRSAACG
jgi:hypothetical protein